MRIASIWAKAFRSLRDVRVDVSRAHNVFYGPNGSGKSNLLAVPDLVVRLSALALERFEALNALETKLLTREPALIQAEFAGAAAVSRGLLREDDLFGRSAERKLTLGLRWSDLPKDFDGALDVEVTVDWSTRAAPLLWLSVREQGDDVGRSLMHDSAQGLTNSKYHRLLAEELTKKGYALVDADRAPRAETRATVASNASDTVIELLRQGKLKNALLHAQTSPDAMTRRRLAELRKLLQGPPLHRPPFDPVQDPQTGEVDLREALAEPNPEGRDVPLNLAGLGIAQVYGVLAHAMLSGADIVAIEEPEAHLYLPKTGRDLRALLQRLVREGHIKQIFIATHSSLFDLDDTGFFEVSLNSNGETVVEKKPLDAIDRHVYEPGPTLHAFEELLRLSEPDRVMFRRADGAPVTAKEMLSLLRAADPLALEYLQDLHRAAVDVVGLRARRKAAS